jgi:hypothetical protein
VAPTFLGSPGPNSLTSFAQLADPVRLQAYLSLDQADIQRLNRYAEFWRFYLGRHWTIERENNEPLVTLNYCRRLLEKHTDWLTGKGKTFKVQEVLRNLTLPLLKRVWRNNAEAVLDQEMSQSGAVSGDIYVMINFEPATLEQRRRNPYATGHTRLKVLPSEQVFPRQDPLDYKKLLEVRIETLFYDVMEADPRNPQTTESRQLQVRRFTQTWTPSEVITELQGDKEGPKKQPNPYGEIPIVHIPNLVVVGNFHGMSDLDGLTELQKEINEKATDLSDIAHYHAAPITVITGAKAGDVERGVGKVWSGLPPEAKVSHLESGSAGANASMSYLEFVKKSMFEIGSVPISSLGADVSISNTSAAALEIQHGPLVELNRRKHGPFIEGMKRINYFIIRTEELTNPDFKVPVGLCCNCGGRVITFEEENGARRRKCFHVDSQTFELIPPEKMPVQYVRRNSFGKTVVEGPLERANEEESIKAPSEFDPERRKKLDGEDKELDPIMGLEPELPPEEPEEIEVQDQQIDAEGNVVDVGEPRKTMAVPTGCKSPDYLDPYDSEIVMGNPLPTDEDGAADRHTKNIAAGIYSPDWVRERMPDMDPEKERRRVESHQRKAAQMTSATAGHEPPKKEPSSSESAKAKGEEG